ncbi:MAG: exopolysaccharide biosynthesis protein [Mesorhizobium sp.]|uniref:polysaccharide biosynthesis/export family protein n=1 Tax=Mesorhizobium sp. TaxID=1871066 RepID=UPI001200204D|nr:polysaccharide biosynthesis/export family protein [Mesorhizobium sp.]TIM26414.1 MAG: exopolysaccharide biosynthesis protein [Mesorhizobium sp.]
MTDKHAASLSRTAYGGRAWARAKTFLIVAGALLVTAAVPAHSEYRLHAGDVIELSVAGAPQLGLRVPVQLDGTLTFPLVGTLEARRQTVSEIRDRIQTALASKVLRLHAADGQEFLRAVEREDIAVSVVEYRPVVVSGDVARPGEVTFRSDMTVRQALASAGGLLSSPTAPAYDVAGLRSDFVTAWLSLAAHNTRVWRLKSELGENVPFDRSAVPPLPIHEADLAAIQELEIAYRDANREDHRRQKEYLASSIAQADEHIDVLTQQRAVEEQGAAVDTAELERSSELLANGTVKHDRVTDARRAVLLSSTRLLQTRAQLMQVRRLRQDLARELEKLDSGRTMALVQQLQEATIKLASERERLRSVEQKLQLAGGQVPLATVPNQPPEVIVYRYGGRDGPVTLRADYDRMLEPGDVLEVTMVSSIIKQVTQ